MDLHFSTLLMHSVGEAALHGDRLRNDMGMLGNLWRNRRSRAALSLSPTPCEGRASCCSLFAIGLLLAQILERLLKSLHGALSCFLVIILPVQGIAQCLDGQIRVLQLHLLASSLQLGGFFGFDGPPPGVLRSGNS